MRVAAIQVNSTADLGRNLSVAEGLVRDAAADGAELVALPEKWNVLGEAEALRSGAEALDGPTLTAVKGWARELGVTIVAGSIAERVEGLDHLFNTSALIDADGEIVASYRKIHLFDVDVGGVSYRESDTEAAGEDVVSADADLDRETVEIGLSVCYDLRFPELYRILALGGARIVTVPAAFTAVTGRDHWEVLLRARAIENQFFVVAPNQVGQALPHYDSWGHSMIVDPWGTVLAEAADSECFVAADLDLAEQKRVRSELPSLANRRPGAYRWPQEVRA
ncbi:MAG: carbon-nitrogen hydrolase family protein [bacterium]